MTPVERRALVFYVSAFFLLLPYGIAVGADGVFRFGLVSLDDDHWLIAMQVGVAVCTFLAWGALIALDRLFGAIPGVRQKCRWVLFILLASGLGFLFHDSAPYAFPYNWDDVPRVSSENRASYDLLETNLMGPDAKIDIENPRKLMAKAEESPIASENEILRSWTAAEDARRMIIALDRYAQIADLSTPSTAIDLNIMQVAFLSRLYRAHALLMAEKGRWEDGIRELGQMYSVARKALPYARYLIHKLLWTSVAEGCIDTAYRISRNPRIPEYALQKLLVLFQPLGETAVSFTGTLVSEAMFIHHSIGEDKLHEDVTTAICDSIWYDDICIHVWNRLALRFFSWFIYKPQSTENHIFHYLSTLMQASEQHPPEIHQLEKGPEAFARPIFGNTLGWIAQNSPLPDFSEYIVRLAETKVQSDLLHLHLQYRIGKKTVMKDYLCDGDYIPTSEPGLFKSAGWDGTAGTEDDITMDRSS